LAIAAPVGIVTSVVLASTMKGLIVAPLAIDQADPLLPAASDNAHDSQWRAASVVARDLECPANLVQMAERVADQ